MRFSHFRISTLLVAGSAVFVAVVVAVALLASYIARDSNHSIQTLYQQRMVPMEHLKKLSDLYADVLFKASQLALGRGDTQAAQQEVGASVAAIQGNWDSLSKLAVEPDDVSALKSANDVATKVAPALAELQDALAKKDRIRINLVAVDLNELVNAISKEIRKLEQVQLDHAGEDFGIANGRYASSIVAFASIVALAVVVIAAAAWFMVRQISRPIFQAVAIAKRVATGDMSETIAYAGKSEMAEVLHALSDMQSSLSRVVSEVRTSADRLAVSSQEIAQGNQDLSDRTEQQSSLLEQTSHAAMGLNATVKENTDSASQANALALEAARVAAQGGEVVREVVSTMRDIDDASKKIADIIGVIDGIAFQTNILALNAAVEAARAGEQGRGFAVVASEVRALAGRSAEAAKEIKSLIGASTQRVEAGTALVDRAGSTMNEVVDAIRRVTDIVAHIADSTHTQNEAVEMVENSVEHIAQATQKNSALVEEIASAANALSGQAQSLVASVATFKVQGQASGARAGLLLGG